MKTRDIRVQYQSMRNEWIHKLKRPASTFLFFALVPVLALLLIQCGGSPETQAVNAIQDVLDSAYEKNPTGIQQQLEDDPAKAYEVMNNIVNMHPDIQVVLAEHDLFEEQERLFAEAWTRFVSDKMTATDDRGAPPTVPDTTEPVSE